jgi:hypothetical protein
MTNTVGAPSFAFFCEGSEAGMRAQVGLITCLQQNQIAHAASPPTYKKRKDGAPSVGMVHAKIVKGGHPPSG